MTGNKKNVLSGKLIRHLSMILSGVIVLATLVVNAVAGRCVIPMSDAIKAAVFILLIGLPIDVSMWLKIVLGFFHIRIVPDDGKGEVSLQVPSLTAEGKVFVEKGSVDEI